MEKYIKNLPSSSNSHMFCVGMSGAGKTTLIFDELLKHKLKYHFDDIVIMTETYFSNKSHYLGLNLELKLNKMRKHRILNLMFKTEFDNYITNEYFDWVSVDLTKKSIYEIYMTLPKEQQDIIYDDIDTNLLSYDDEELKLKRIYRHFDEGALTKIFNDKLKTPEKKLLVIIDDCSVCPSFRQSNAVKSILRNGRSRNMTLYVLGQRSLDLHPDLRSQFSMAVIFYSSHPSEREAIFNTIGSHSKTKFIDIFFSHFKTLPKYSYCFVIINESDEDNKMFFNNDTKPFTIK